MFAKHYKVNDPIFRAQHFCRSQEQVQSQSQGMRERDWQRLSKNLREWSGFEQSDRFSESSLHLT